MLSKRARSRLRHFLYLMTMCMVMTNPEVRALQRHNVEEKKQMKMKSIMKLCSKKGMKPIKVNCSKLLTSSMDLQHAHLVQQLFLE